MEPPIQSPDARYELESQLRDCYGRVSYGHKTHEKMAERDNKYLKRTKWATIVLSAVTAGGAIAVIIDKSTAFYAVITAIFATMSVILSSYLKDIDPGSSAQKHREAASKLWNVRETYLSLLADIRDGSIPLENIRKRRDSLQAELLKIYSSAPHTDGDAYQAAQHALKKNEDLTFSDSELDHLLPPSLQRGAKSQPAAK